MKKRRINGEGVTSFLMLLPAIVFLCVCSIYPFIWIFRYVNYNYNGFTATYTGSANFERMLKDTTFWASVGHTFEYALYKLIFIIPLALVIAVILHNKIKGANFFRGIYGTDNDRLHQRSRTGSAAHI